MTLGLFFQAPLLRVQSSKVLSHELSSQYTSIAPILDINPTEPPPPQPHPRGDAPIWGESLWVCCTLYCTEALVYSDHPRKTAVFTCLAIIFGQIASGVPLFLRSTAVPMQLSHRCTVSAVNGVGRGRHLPLYMSSTGENQSQSY